MEKAKDTITLIFGDDEITIKKPSRAVVSMALSKGMVDPLAQAEVIIENCYVDGTMTKEAVLADVGLLIGINAQYAKLIGYKQVEIKN